MTPSRVMRPPVRRPLTSSESRWAQQGWENLIAMMSRSRSLQQKRPMVSEVSSLTRKADSDRIAMKFYECSAGLPECLSRKWTGRRSPVLLCGIARTSRRRSLSVQHHMCAHCGGCRFANELERRPAYMTSLKNTLSEVVMEAILQKSSGLWLVTFSFT